MLSLEFSKCRSLSNISAFCAKVAHREWRMHEKRWDAWFRKLNVILLECCTTTKFVAYMSHTRYRESLILGVQIKECVLRCSKRYWYSVSTLQWEKSARTCSYGDAFHVSFHVNYPKAKEISVLKKLMIIWTRSAKLSLKFRKIVMRSTIHFFHKNEFLCVPCFESSFKTSLIFYSIFWTLLSRFSRIINHFYVVSECKIRMTAVPIIWILI